MLSRHSPATAPWPMSTTASPARIAASPAGPGPYRNSSAKTAPAA